MCLQLLDVQVPGQEVDLEATSKDDPAICDDQSVAWGVYWELIVGHKMSRLDQRRLDYAWPVSATTVAVAKQLATQVS